MEKCAVFHCVTLPIKRFYSFYLSFKKKLTYFVSSCLFVCVWVCFSQPRLLVHLICSLFHRFFSLYFVFIDVIKQRFMINVLRYVCVCLFVYVLGLLARTDCSCCCCWCCYRLLIILIVLTGGFWIVYFLFILWCVSTLCSFAAFILDLFSVFADLLFVVYPFAGLLAPPLCLFCLLVYFFGC